MTEEEKEEAAQQARDDRVSKTLLARLADNSAEKRELQEQIHQLDRDSSRIREAVNQGHWWELQDLISEADRDSLAECEPFPTSSILDD